MDDCSYFEKELAFVFDRAGVVGRPIYIVDFEGFLDFPQVDLVSFCEVDIDAVDVGTAINKYSCVDVFSVSGVEHVGWNTKLL